MLRGLYSDAGQRRLSLRLAQDDQDLTAVQRLRWQVFHAEMGAAASAEAASSRPENLDADVYDPLCDHLLVIDEDAPVGERVVGTYRLLRESVAAKTFGFYSAGEFDLRPLAGAGLSGAEGAGELLELGRSCVLPPYRTSGTISLLWRGIADYIACHDIALMFGCASFAGTDPDMHAAALSYLHHHHLAPADRRPAVLPGQGISLERLAPGSYDERRAAMGLPPLVKAYMRVGAKFGEGAFVDRPFNTIDVCVVMPVELIADRYAARFSAAA